MTHLFIFISIYMRSFNRILVFIVLMTSALTVAAQTDTVSMDEVVVTGTRVETNQRHLPTTISTVSRQQLTENFRTSILPTISELVPGLFVTSRGVMGYGVANGAAGTMKIRGIGGTADLLVLIDGLPQYAGIYGHPIPDTYLTMMAEKVEILRGPASLFYGSNAMGGVMNIVSRTLPADGVLGNAQIGWGSYGTLQTEFNTLFRSGKLNGAAGVSYDQTDGQRANSQFKQGAGFLKLGYDLSRNWSINSMTNLTWFNASNPGEDFNPYIDNDSRILRGIASLSISNQYASTSGALRGFLSWGHHHVNDGYHPGGTPRTQLYLHNDLMAGVSAYQNFSLFQGNLVTGGFDWQHFGGHAWNRNISSGVEKDIIDKTEDDFAGYVDFRQDLLSWITADAGLRVDYHSQVGTELIPQGGITFHLPSQAEIRAMVSKGFRNPTIRELYMYVPANTALEPERLMNYELSYKQRFLQNRLRLGANLFYLNASNLISTESVNGKPLNVNTGNVKNWGFEFESAYKILPQLEVDANYSFLHMKKHLTAAPQHKAYAGLKYSLNKLSVSSGLQYINGLYTSVGKNEHQENFWLWNLTTSYRIHPNFRIFAKGENLLAQKYEVIAGFPMPRATFMGGVNISF